MAQTRRLFRRTCVDRTIYCHLHTGRSQLIHASTFFIPFFSRSQGKLPADVLPLHEALVAHAPFKVIETMVRSYPHALAATETSYRRLPLHCACRKNADAQTVRFLVEQYKAACLVADALTRCPIHYALTNGADEEICEILIGAAPEAARSVDDRGWTPLHVAVNVGASEKVVKLLTDAYPEATLIRTAKGTSIRVTASKTGPEVESLIRETRKEVDEKVHLPNLNEEPQMGHELA